MNQLLHPLPMLVFMEMGSNFPKVLLDEIWFPDITFFYGLKSSIGLKVD